LLRQLLVGGQSKLEEAERKESGPGVSDQRMQCVAIGGEGNVGALSLACVMSEKHSLQEIKT